ncbi:MAG TPA: hypothetical protein DCZ72_05115 [Armatimonadetes bacterium]|nr:hypothetical protein [Armatimonadota bacterium]
MVRRVIVVAVAAVVAACGPGSAQVPPWLVVLSPDNALGFQFVRQGEVWLSWSPVGWGPNWAWRGLDAQGGAVDGGYEARLAFAAGTTPDQVINLVQHVRQVSPTAVEFAYDLSADADVALQALVMAWSAGETSRDGQLTMHRADGGQATRGLNFAGMGVENNIVAMTLDAGAAGKVEVGLEPANNIAFDNGLRLLLAENNFPAGARTLTVTFDFGEDVGLVVSDADLARYTEVVPGDDWFPFTGTADSGPSVVGFESWIERPAGARGGVRMVGDRFELADGTPIKFWGTNLSYALSAPPKDQGAGLAAKFAKWGVNAVRMHKFTNPVGWEGIGDPNDMTKMDPEGLDRLDAFSQELRAAGVYYGWSHSFGVKVREGNRDRLLAPEEVLDQGDGATYALINFAPDLQDLMIEMVVELLNHENPYTGQRYADDPALCFIELQNEDDIFFYTSEGALNNYPTYRAQVQQRFAQWLTAKYGNEAGLRAAWGDALTAGESLAAGNLALQGNPWFFGSGHLPQQNDNTRRRLLDNAAFFHDLQNEFYSRFAAAIRATGYEGPLVGSPWQAPAMVPHYYNLRSDALVGYVDRHNYFGERLNDTMLGEPGSGYLSSGLQQVAGRPFGLSEWITVYPALYSAEGPPLVAAYGMGLQGWGASYEFQSGAADVAWNPIAGQLPWGVWNVDTPTQLGQYPILARMVARGDVTLGDVVATRRVSPANLETGEFDFSDTVSQDGDRKDFGGVVPPAALALGRVLVEFTDDPTPSDLLADAEGLATAPVVTSTTGELSWDREQRVVTINTAGTKGLVGFAGGQSVDLGGVTLASETPYVSLLVTASEPDRDLSDCATALISAVGRISNTGMRIFSLDQRVLEHGGPPMLVEPVQASVSFGRPIAQVNILDHDGRRTGRAASVDNGRIVLDGAAEKALWYEVVFAP